MPAPVPVRISGGTARAFTLVELLTTVAIIGVLAALLFPAGARMVEASRAAKCTNNLRQLGIAALAWSAENDGYMIPCDSDPATNSAYWPTVLAPYVNLDFAVGDPKKQPSLYRCPSSESHFSADEKQAYFVSYRANQLGSGKSYGHFGPPTNYYMLKLSAVNPATFPLLVDGAPRAKAWRGWFGFSQGDKDLIGFYHEERANRLYLDGHVDSAPLKGWTPMTLENWRKLGFSTALPTY